jgi:Tat protein translocase TatB subunit
MDFPGIGVGPMQLLVILVVAFFVLGPERLPELARQIARGIRTLRSYASDVQGQFEGEIGGLRDEFADIQRDFSSIQGNLRGGLADLDSSLRAVSGEVQSAVAAPVVSFQDAVEARGGSASTVDYAPPAPRPVAYIPDAPAPEEMVMPADGSGPRLPDYRPPA